jgi:hypothetical protein
MRNLWPLAVIVIIIAGFRLGGYAHAGNQLLISNIYDDGFYYFEIAQHIVRGDGITFDGLSHTNGFQPLWMVCLLPFVGVFRPISVAAGLLLFNVINIGMYLVMAYMFWRILRRLFGLWPAHLAILLLAYSRVTTLFIGGVEAPLLGLLIVVFTAFVLRLLESRHFPSRSLWSAAWIGGAICLTRLDYTIPVAGFFIAMLGWQFKTTRNTRSVIQSAIILAIPCTALLVSYFFFNLAYFGHPLPISGLLKTGSLGFHHGTTIQELLRGDKGVLLLVLTGPAALLFWWIRGRLARSQDGLAGTILKSWAFACTLYSAFLLSSVVEIAKWYLVFPALLVVAMVAWIVHYVSSIILHRPSLVRGLRFAIGIFLILCAVQSQYARFLQHNRKDSASAAFFKCAQWCDSHLSPQMIIGLPDAGAFAFLTRIRVMNTDGLVNDWEYALACRQGRALDVLRARGVTHFMSAFGSRVHRNAAGNYEYLLATLSVPQPGNTAVFRSEDVLYSQTYFSGELNPPRDSLMIWIFK